MSSYLSRKVSRKTTSTDTSAEKVSGNKKTSSIDPPAIEELSRIQELCCLIHQLSRISRDCDKKRQPGVEEVSRKCRDYLKIIFQEGKNIDINAIKHATQPKIHSTV